MIAAAVILLKIITYALKDNGEATPFFIMSWVYNFKILNSLIDKGAIIEIINLRVINALRGLEVFEDGNVVINLANDNKTLLRKWV